jgi:hypothetical protein
MGVDQNTFGLTLGTMITRYLLACALALSAASGQTTPAARAISERITADDLKADVSFLASDALEGRGTPSRGLDIASEFIAAQFRRAGLEPAGNDGYFQTADFVKITPRRTGFSLVFRLAAKTLVVPPSGADILIPARVNIPGGPAIKVGAPAQLTPMAESRKRGRVVISEQGAGFRMAFAENPAMLVLLSAPPDEELPRSILRRAGAPLPQVPVVVIRDAAARQALRAAASIRVSARMAAPVVEAVTLKNVVGVLRGAEGPLRDSYLLLTAHYDHLGLRAAGSGDRVYNGANDNASGSAALIEIARALSKLPSPPARSIIFAALFGEENGALGSRYYVERPPIPLEKTVADINLEQLGRTDDTEGVKLLQFNLTGYDFSTLGEQFAKVAPECGVHVVNDRKRGDAYFERSDNISFSRAGMPSTTVSVSYEFPDYHGLGDEWPKISYNNMQQVTCGIAISVLSIANSPDPPHWNSGNQESRRYIK